MVALGETVLPTAPFVDGPVVAVVKRALLYLGLHLEPLLLQQIHGLGVPVVVPVLLGHPVLGDEQLDLLLDLGLVERLYLLALHHGGLGLLLF